MTHVIRLISRALGAGLALVLPPTLVLTLVPRADAAPPAARVAGATSSAIASAAGQSSLATLLTSDGDTFDHSWSDFDITTQAVLAVIAAKPSSKVALLADGSVALTAFVPTDRAFYRLGRDVLGHRFRNEHYLFDALVRTLGVATIEKVLLYHVVPGQTITSAQALRADGAKLTTALGPKITVHVLSRRHGVIFLGDKDPDDRDPRLLKRYLDLNQGNRQIAHGINRVLRPADL